MASEPMSIDQLRVVEPVEEERVVASTACGSSTGQPAKSSPSAEVGRGAALRSPISRSTARRVKPRIPEAPTTATEASISTSHPRAQRCFFVVAGLGVALAVGVVADFVVSNRRIRVQRHESVPTYYGRLVHRH